MRLKSGLKQYSFDHNSASMRPAGRAPSSAGAATSTFFTIGHSTRTIVEFVDLLRESRVDFVADVRSMPRSRTNPHFNGESLPETLVPWQIGYEHIAALGGRGIERRVVRSHEEIIRHFGNEPRRGNFFHHGRHFRFHRFFNGIEFLDDWWSCEAWTWSPRRGWHFIWICDWVD
jgi:uncharacterized protein DUF488